MKEAQPNYFTPHLLNSVLNTESAVNKHSGFTWPQSGNNWAHGMNTIWRRKLLSNLLSRAYTKQVLTPRCEPFLGAEDRDSMYAFFLCTDGRGGCQGVPPKLIRKPLKSCQLLNLDQQKAKAAGTPSGTWYPLLCFGNSVGRRGSNA